MPPEAQDHRPTDSIAIITYDCMHGGSVGAVAWQQALQLSRKFRVFVISKSAPSPRPDNVSLIAIQPRTWGWLRRLAHIPNDLSFQRAAKNALDKLCRNNELTAVWCHAHSVLLYATGPATKLDTCKRILVTHGDISDRPAGTYDYFLTRYYRYVTPKAYHVADLIQALSPYVASIIGHYPGSKNKIRIIPNGISLEEIGIRESSPRNQTSFLFDNQLKILYVGSLNPVKGVDQLLVAAAELKDKKVNFQITIAGSGSLRTKLERLCKKLQISENILFTGQLNRKDLNKLYLAADVLCAPSVSDALPTVILEAMVCGLPVVGANTGGISSLLVHSPDLLFHPGDTTNLANILLRLTNDPKYLAQVSAKGMSRAKSEYNWKVIGEKLHQLTTE